MSEAPEIPWLFEFVNRMVRELSFGDAEPDEGSFSELHRVAVEAALWGFYIGVCEALDGRKPPRTTGEWTPPRTPWLPLRRLFAGYLLNAGEALELGLSKSDADLLRPQIPGIVDRALMLADRRIVDRYGGTYVHGLSGLRRRIETFKLRRLVDAGLTVDEAAAELGIARATAFRRLARKPIRHG